MNEEDDNTEMNEDVILVHNLEDEHVGGRYEYEGEDEFEDENEDGDNGEDTEMEEMMIPWVIITFFNINCLEIIMITF
jgi:hypothetical protein